jgi:Uncharacterized conserved protein
MSRLGRAETQSDSCNRLTVNGKATVTAAPDRASVVLGVVTEGASLKDIQRENAAKMAKVIAALKRMGIDEKDIGTHSYFINTVYDQVNNKQQFKGYRVTNTIKVNIKDIQRIGEIIDAAVSNGANIVESIDFTLSDQSAYYRQALSLAVKDAIENAKTIGRTLNVVVDDVPVSVTEEAPSYVPFAVKSTFAAYEAATPIKPGLIDITAKIKAVFCYREI